jgi:hypothetical protein
MVSLLAAHRRLVRPWLLALLSVIATLAPWLLELAGVFESRMSVTGNSIVLETATTALDPNATIAGLFIYIVALIHLAALVARLVDDDRRKVRRAMQRQSWQLRQLPRVSSRPPHDASSHESHAAVDAHFTRAQRQSHAQSRHSRFTKERGRHEDRTHHPVHDRHHHHRRCPAHPRRSAC